MIPQFKPYMAPDVEDFVVPTLHSGFISQGEKVELFEAALSRYLGYEFGVTVNSATSGLMLALRLVGAKKGKNVVSTPMTCSATNEAIALSGADIIWADVDEFGNISPESVAQKVNPNTVAVMAVDWGGLPCDYELLREAASGAPIIEDAAHAFGATYQGYPIGNNGGDYVVFSFQAIKHLTTGDGGLLVLPHRIAYERAKLLRWYGLDRTSSSAMRSRQDIKEVGYKFHMNDIAAAIGIANLRYMDTNLSKHRENAAFYDSFLSDFRPDWPEDRKSSYWLYTIHVDKPVEFESFARECGFIASQTHMRNDNYTIFNEYKDHGLNKLRMFSMTMVCIPVGWWVETRDLEWIIDCVHAWREKAR